MVIHPTNTVKRERLEPNYVLVQVEFTRGSFEIEIPEKPEYNQVIRAKNLIQKKYRTHDLGHFIHGKVLKVY